MVERKLGRAVLMMVVRRCGVQRRKNKHANQQGGDMAQGGHGLAHNMGYVDYRTRTACRLGLNAKSMIVVKVLDTSAGQLGRWWTQLMR
jgi:hypothetical protein